MPTAFIVFSNEKRPTLKKGLSFGDTGKELGKMWRALSDAEKAKYQALATPSKSGKPAKAAKKGK
jgi:hypothetical protein